MAYLGEMEFQMKQRHFTNSLKITESVFKRRKHLRNKGV